MAIVQISQITNRLGLAADLPQLAGAEFGWSTDTRQLWIGNGTLEEGAPVIGNTEILTEFSAIINPVNNYTYKGEAAGYIVQTGPTPGTPVTQNLQTWLDQFATVKDFGAKGDGITDDTDAINRALNQLYCIQSNPQIRRSLFFPAGVYVVSDTINIPPYATLYGEGPENSIIQLVDGASADYVAQTADSLQNTGVNIGNGGATPPTDINIINMAFQTLDGSKSVFLVQSATNCEFRAVSFAGTTATLSNATAQTSGVNCLVAPSGTSDILFDGCRFGGTTYGLVSNQNTKGIVVINSSFNLLYQGVNLGSAPVNGGPTGTRINNNTFDNIYSQGIFIGAINLNLSGYNIFYDVANHFLGTANPQESIILIEGNNNASVGDMFERSDLYATTYPRINLVNTTSIATTNGSQIQLGTKTIKSGLNAALVGNQSNVTIFTLTTSTSIESFKIDYSIIRNTGYRTGTLVIASNQGGIPQFTDDYTENVNLGITLSVTQTGSVISVKYSSLAGQPATMSYSTTYFG